MAEALARHHDEVRGRLAVGYASAGTHALTGRSATRGAVAVLDELGVDLRSHRATPLHPALEEPPDRVFCMEEWQVEWVVAQAPNLRGRVTMLRPDGGEIPDPFGSTLRHYRRTRDQILTALEVRLQDHPPDDAIGGGPALP